MCQCKSSIVSYRVMICGGQGSPYFGLRRVAISAKAGAGHLPFLNTWPLSVFIENEVLSGVYKQAPIGDLILMV